MDSNTRLLNSAEAAREATQQLLKKSDQYFVIGEGVPDPKACFGTTKDLKTEFPNRVFDMPLSENGGVGICIGAAMAGMRPIMIHMRQDFLLYAADQIINNAAKMHSMYGGKNSSVPLLIRAFTGRGWGAGQQHSQNLEALFAHIPGLKVVSPSNAHNTKGLLIAAAEDNNPVLMLEHRWIHPITSHVPEEMYQTPIGKAQVVQEGSDITIVSWGYMMTEARIAADHLKNNWEVSVELIDMLSLRPLDWETVAASADKTKKVVIASEAWRSCGVASEIATSVYEAVSGVTIGRVTNPDFSPPSTPALTKAYYPKWWDILKAAGAIMLTDFGPFEKSTAPHDVPNPEFRGPF